MSIVNSDDSAGAVKVQVQSAIARILHHRYNTEQDRKLLFITLIHARTPCCRAY